MKIIGDKAVFSTGREVDCTMGTIGLDTDLDVRVGYDGDFAEFEDDLTPAENIELADYMIARWTEYRQKSRDRHLKGESP